MKKKGKGEGEKEGGIAWLLSMARLFKKRLIRGIEQAYCMEVPNLAVEGPIKEKKRVKKYDHFMYVPYLLLFCFGALVKSSSSIIVHKISNLFSLFSIIYFIVYFILIKF